MAIIKKRAIKAFLARPRKDFRVYKDIGKAKLETMMAALPCRPPIWNKLQLHQKVCFIIGARKGRFLFLNDTGTGKTLLAISLARYFRKLRLIRRVLVLIPNRINKEEWAAELQKHSPRSSYLILDGSTEEKWQALEETKTLFVFETYAGLTHMVCERVPGRRKNKMKPVKALVRRLQALVQGVIADESVAIKNHASLQYRICRQLAKTSKILFPMTGTPFNRDPSDLWSQAYIVDFGKTLGETLGLFRAAFFKSKMNYWGGMEHTFDRSKNKLLNKFLAGCSISYEADAASLPKVVPIKKFVDLPEENKEYYERAKQTIRQSRGNFQEVKNAFLRMRQISSGFIGFKNDETGERARLIFPENPKLELLLSTIASIRQDHKVIVFYEYTYSGLRIVKELTELGIGAVQLYSGTKDLQETRRQFREDRPTQVLVLQNRFGVGLNVQVAKYGIYYEGPVSAITRKQTRRRVERQLSTHSSVFIYDLLMRDTVDERILKFAQEGDNLFKALIRGSVEV